jgi:hypothetical protein
MQATLRAELESARVVFHLLLDSLSDAELMRRSHNPAWTNKQIMFHIALGFFLLPGLSLVGLVFGRLPRHFSRAFAHLLNDLTGPFNAINAAGAYGGGLVLSRVALARIFDAVHALSLLIAENIPADDWKRGMFFPTAWDPLFTTYMTLEDVFRFPVRHLYAHTKHIAR